MWGDWKVVIYVLLHGNQMIDFNKYFSQSGQFKAAIDETHGGGGGIIFIRIILEHTLLW